MAPTAYCLNEDCSKDQWTLQKHPDEYKRGVTCPECGTTRVDVDTDEPRGVGGRQEPEPRSGDGRRGGEDVPARRDERQREATDVARRGDGPMDMGGAEATIALLDDDTDRKTKAQAGMKALDFGRELLGKFSQWQEQKEEAREAKVQRMSLEKESKYPDCPECSYTFTPDDVTLSDEQVRCPDCGEVLNINLPDEPENA